MPSPELSEDHPSDLASAGIDFRLLEGLISGRRFSVSFQSIPPRGWEKPIRYVGVRAATGESVLVGTLVAETGGPGEIIGIEAALDSLAGREAIQAIWVVNDLLDLIGTAAFEGQNDPMADAALSTEDQDLATRSLGMDGAMSYLGDRALHVAAPILDRGGVATGAAVIHMQRDHLDRLFADHIKYGLIVAAAAFAIGYTHNTHTHTHTHVHTFTLTHANVHRHRHRYKHTHTHAHTHAHTHSHTHTALPLTSSSSSSTSGTVTGSSSSSSSATSISSPPPRLPNLHSPLLHLPPHHHTLLTPQ